MNRKQDFVFAAKSIFRFTLYKAPVPKKAKNHFIQTERAREGGLRCPGCGFSRLYQTGQ
jgi:hypothetical protein